MTQTLDRSAIEQPLKERWPFQVLTLEEIRHRLRAQEQECIGRHRPGHQGYSVPSWTGSDHPRWKKRQAELVSLQKMSLSGFTDRQGNYWCWQCFLRSELVNLGQDTVWEQIPRSCLGMGLTPEAEWPSWFVQAKEQGFEGYNAWRLVAANAPDTIIADVTWHFTRGPGKDLVLAL